MRVLVAYEMSGVVREAFRRRGHDAISVDLLPSELPGPHHQGDLIEYLEKHEAEFDLGIFFHPCTHLATAGARWFPLKQKEQAEAITTFLRCANSSIPKTAIENPIGIMSTLYRKPDQWVQPYMFGDPYEKKTGIWVKNLPLLVPTNLVQPGPRHKFPSGASLPLWYSEISPGPKRAMIRSRTFPGLAEAMASQWG